MKKILLTLLLLLCLIISWTGVPEDSDTSSTIEDQIGRQVNIHGTPKRIVSMAPSQTEILYAIGAGDLIVGNTEYCTYPPEAKDKPKIGGYVDINIEKIVECAPHIVFGSGEHMTKVIPALEELGITVVVMQQESIEMIYEAIEITGDILGLEKEAHEVTSHMREKYIKITDKVKSLGTEPISLFWELSGDLWTPGPGSFLNELIIAAGGENIASDAPSPWVQLSGEVIIEKDPQVIFLADHFYGESLENVKKRAGWDTISAVKNNRIIEITDPDFISRPGPRSMEALEFIASNLHTGAF